MGCSFFAEWRIPVPGALIFVLSMAMFSDGWAQQAGEELFQTTCAACHTIGGGRLVGPDLAGCNEARSQEWLEQFVKSPQTMIKNEDSEAVALLAEYNGIMMPDTQMSGHQIQDVLHYIRVTSEALKSSGGEGATPAPTVTLASTPEDIEKGRKMFFGAIRLEKGGVACNACHDVRHDAIVGGGNLSLGLNKVFTKYDDVTARVHVHLHKTPHPIMRAAYADNPLTEEEIMALIAFLKHADTEETTDSPKYDGIGLFLSGAVGAAILFLFFGIFWRGRKSGSVNQAIYERQVTSVVEDRV
ncbi:MAG: c-type cytochrome [Gammaproteobacteria bacterium]|jgi:hypothetical protein|nr:cytochrome C [Chromatiales bacterium]MCP4927133.1 c-type cytochrome [Gammaproteobacteria bacterium]MDP6149639.1 c-type cytochrome [Gammaproteobacteria bacterium]MDP7093301.1 c-type cytochrome [Gammaproteobacteria bacterium]MDP7420182.1 c-type cytochrome [Gammaproteobacteria bacterium]